jgi:serine/threonine protein kinase
VSLIIVPEDKHQNLSSRTTAIAPLSDRYELMERIGEGGMGTVYKARQIATDRVVAIKFLSDQFVSDDVRRTRFEHEARAASSLYHPNLVSIVDFGCDENARPYLVQEYIPGIGLDVMLRAKGRLEPHDLIEIFSQICKGLSHVHHKGIVHRDLKPSNIMVVKDEAGDLQVKIVDFGIAKQDRTQAITQTGELLGSPLYMSPEQALGQQVDARSDIYSVGCMLYESAVGKPPFMGENSISTLVMRLNHEPVAFEQAAPFCGMPEGLEKAVMRALRRDPAERYQTIAALQADLKELERVSPPKPSATIQGLRTLRSQNSATPPPVVAFSDRPRWLEVGALMTVIVLLAGTAAGFAYLWSQSHNKTSPHAVESTPPVVAEEAKPAVAKEPPKPVPVESKPIAAAIKPQPKPKDENAATPKIIPLPADVIADMAEAKKEAQQEKEIQDARVKAAIERAAHPQPAQAPVVQFLDENGQPLDAAEIVRRRKKQQEDAAQQDTPIIDQSPSSERMIEDPNIKGAAMVMGLTRKANMAIAGNHYEHAAALLTRALQILHDNHLERTEFGAQLHDDLGRCFASVGDPDSANREFRHRKEILDWVNHQRR